MPYRPLVVRCYPRHGRRERRRQPLVAAAFFVVLLIGAFAIYWFKFRPDAGQADGPKPDVKVDDKKKPDVKLPDVKVPDVKLPDVKLPDMKLSPEVQGFSAALTKYIAGLGDAVGTIKDEKTGTDALPKLTEISGKFDELKTMFDKLPDAAKAIAKPMIANALTPLKDVVGKATALPVVGEKIKGITDPLMAKLAELAK